MSSTPINNNEQNEPTSSVPQSQPDMPTPSLQKMAKLPRKQRKGRKKLPPPGRQVTIVTRNMIYTLRQEDALIVALISKGAPPESFGLTGKLALERKAQAYILLAGLAWCAWSKCRTRSKTPTGKAQKRNRNAILTVLDAKIEMAKDTHTLKWPESAAAVEAVAKEIHSLAKDLPPLPPPQPPQTPEAEQKQHTKKVLRGFEHLASSLERASRGDIVTPLRELRNRFASRKG